MLRCEVYFHSSHSTCLEKDPCKMAPWVERNKQAMHIITPPRIIGGSNLILSMSIYHPSSSLIFLWLSRVSCRHFIEFSSKEGALVDSFFSWPSLFLLLSLSLLLLWRNECRFQKVSRFPPKIRYFESWTIKVLYSKVEWRFASVLLQCWLYEYDHNK